MKLTERDIKRFERFVAKGESEECWLWKGGKRRDGYGSFTLAGKQVSAHHVAWFLATGIDRGKLHVLHRCDTPACCNPDHLWLGTNALNIQDRNAKGRQAKGERGGTAKLSSVDVWIIRGIRGLSHREIAERMGVSQRQVCAIRNWKRWAHQTQAILGTRAKARRRKTVKTT